MEHPAPGATPAPVSSTAPRTTPPATPPCPCGRAESLAACCLPVARRLRHGGGGRPTPFDEIRATCSLLLWGLLGGPQREVNVAAALSAASRRFWGPVLATGLGERAARGVGAQRRRDDAPGAGRRSIEGGRPGIRVAPVRAPAAAGEARHGNRLFERTWGATDAASHTWLYASLPAFARADPVLGELALDWLLWDQPWLRGRPAAHWTARNAALGGRARIQRATEAILASRLGLWRLVEAVPRRGFHLVDRITGERTLLHTPSDPWPDADERFLVGRIYTFADWRLLAGRCLLLDGSAAGSLLDALEARAIASRAPAPRDPRWRAWLKAELAPILAAQWLSARLAPPPADRYHGTYC
jgi:hypothetical protein